MFQLGEITVNENLVWRVTPFQYVMSFKGRTKSNVE